MQLKNYSNNDDDYELAPYLDAVNSHMNGKRLLSGQLEYLVENIRNPKESIPADT